MFPGVFTGPKLLINREPVASQEFAAELLGDCDTICAQLAAASGIGAISHRDMQEQEQEQEEEKKGEEEEEKKEKGKEGHEEEKRETVQSPDASAATKGENAHSETPVADLVRELALRSVPAETATGYQIRHHYPQRFECGAQGCACWCEEHCESPPSSSLFVPLCFRKPSFPSSPLLFLLTHHTNTQTQTQTHTISHFSRLPIHVLLLLLLLATGHWPQPNRFVFSDASRRHLPAAYAHDFLPLPCMRSDAWVAQAARVGRAAELHSSSSS